MKNLCSFGLLLPLLLGTLAARAQGVRIGATGTPDASAVLDIVSATKGMLLPRVADVTAIASPAAGLMAYQTGGTPGYYYYCGGQWQQVATAATYGDVKQGLQTADHAGWVRLDGRLTSTLTATQQSRAQALGMTSNLPDATGKVLKQTSGSLLATGGSNAATVAQANLPNLSLTGTTNNPGDHTHAMGTFCYGSVTATQGGTYYQQSTKNSVSCYSYNTAAAGGHTHVVPVPLGGSGTALPVEDAYVGVNQFVYLGQ